MGTSGLPDIYTRSPRAAGPRAESVYMSQANHKCTWYNYYVTRSSYANGFTVFIVVLIAFDCGFKL